MVLQLVKSVSIALFSSLVATISLVGLATQSKAEIKDNFICRQKNGDWITWLRDKDNNTKLYPFVRWVSYTSKEGSLQTRCKDVTYRLNALSDNGLLNELVKGEIDKMPVICGVRSLGDSCTRDNVLIWLKRGQDPDQVIYELWNMRKRLAGQFVDLGGCEAPNLVDEEQLITCVNGQYYYNIRAIIKAVIKQEQSVDESSLEIVEPE